MEKKTLYLVGALKTSHPVNVYGYEQDLPLIWADGMAGGVPVFKTREAADKYAGEDYPVIEIVVKEKP